METVSEQPRVLCAGLFHETHTFVDAPTPLANFEFRIGEILRRTDGKFLLEDKQSHLASACGDTFDMGPSVLVEHDGILILLTSKRTMPMDLGQWKCVGVDPAKLHVIGVKAAVAHRRAYDPFAKANFLIDTQAPCSGDLRRLGYQYIRRPVFPLDSPAALSR